MDRRYYLLKLSLVLIGLATVYVTSRFDPVPLVHQANLVRYSAPDRIEAAAWHTTAAVAHAASWLVHLVTSARL